MTVLRFAIRGLTYHWRIHATVALGVAAATAVLTGALLVGDSVRGSLRALTLDRLGMIDELLYSDRLFRERLVAELVTSEQFAEHYERAAGVMLFPAATVEREMRIYLEQATGEGKPEHIAQRIVEGRLEKFYQDFCLMEQAFVKDPDRSIQDLLNEITAKIGEKITIRRFACFRLGEKD